MRSPLPTDSSAKSDRRRDKSRGATMVEFAIVFVWLFTLIFGIIEGGFAVRARSSVNNAVDDAARRGAVAGTSPDADFQIINQLVSRDVQAAAIEYVVIFDAKGGNAAVPEDCKNGFFKVGECNVIRPVDGVFDLNPASYGCDGGGLGNHWCPIDRFADNENEIAFLGVYVKANYEPILNQIFFEFNFSVDATAVQALETTGSS